MIKKGKKFTRASLATLMRGKGNSAGKGEPRNSIRAND